MKELTTEKVCLALGYFDSVHSGHRALIAAARDYAQKHDVGCAVATFSNNAYLQFNNAGRQVYTYAERCLLLDGLCDYVLPMRFDSRLKNCSAEEFLDRLTSHYDICAFVCGYDYSFGTGAKGDADALKAYCDSHGLDCIVMAEHTADGVRVSTTAVKDLLAEGKVEQAERYLGAPFMIAGKVVHGRGAGRMFDIPTANLKIPRGKLLPMPGVYGTTCVIDGKEYRGATNVGMRPTFGLTKTEVEMMIADFNDNIYDKDIVVYFRKYLRGIIKFEIPAQLSKQIHKDIKWYEND